MAQSLFNILVVLMNVLGGFITLYAGALLAFILVNELVSTVRGSDSKFDGDDLRDIVFIVIAGVGLLTAAKYIGA